MDKLLPTLRLTPSLRYGLIEPRVAARLPGFAYSPTHHIRLLHTTRRRKLHSTRRREAAIPTAFEPEHTHAVFDTVQDSIQQASSETTSTSPETPSPLSKLSTFSIVRSILIQQASAIPLLLRPSIAIMSYFATAKSALFSPDRNPILKQVLKPLIYNQFCAGENSYQVSSTAKSLKSWGVKGIMLCWAREVEFRKEKDLDIAQQLQSQLSTPGAIASAEQVIREWGQGSLKTVNLAGSGDIVSLKFSGAGTLVLSALLSPANAQHPLFSFYLHEICKLARSRGVQLSIDAEQQRFQPGIDALALSLSRQYNGPTPGSAVVYNTYQCYLKCIPAKLSEDLTIAAAEGWTLGAKLVRGAYLGSELRGVIWDTKEGTDAAYDGLAEGLIRRSWTAGSYLNGSGAFPNVDIVLATHNLESVQKAVKIREVQAERGEERVHLVYAQLMGMADHVSAAAIHAGEEAKAKAAKMESQGQKIDVEVPKVYKYLVWGSVQECMRYLVRRAEENRDAAGRTKESRAALWSELRRRYLRR